MLSSLPLFAFTCFRVDSISIDNPYDKGIESIAIQDDYFDEHIRVLKKWLEEEQSNPTRCEGIIKGNAGPQRKTCQSYYVDWHEKGLVQNTSHLFK